MRLLQYAQNEKLEHPTIVGHSLGGFLALWVGATVPGQVGPIVAVDGVPYFPALMNPAATPAFMKAYTGQIKSMYAAMDSAKFVKTNTQTIRSMVSDSIRANAVAESSNLSDPTTVGQAAAEMLMLDIRESVGQIRVPVLLVGSLAITPEDQRASMRQNYQDQVAKIKDHRVVFTETAKHFIQVDDPEWLHSEMDAFLESGR
jgi:N-formylmaleamate deformylase